TNYGTEPVDWTVSASKPWVSLSTTGGSLPGGASAEVNVTINSAASSLPPGFYTDSVVFTNLTDHRGDTVRQVALTVFGSYEIKPTRYAWINPTSHTRIFLPDDGVSPAQPIPFTFSLYDRPYSQVYVGSNGLLGFISQGLNSYRNTALPTTTAPNAAIYPYWDDLDPGAAGSVYIGIEGTAPNRKVVISWVGVRRYGASATRLTFQVLLCEGSNDIIFQYQDVRPNDPYGAGRSATVGIENEAGTAAAQYSYNGSTLLQNKMALLFTSRGPTPLDAKLLPDGAPIATRRAIVSRAFGSSFFYIESEDGLGGIRVAMPGHGVESGMRADVSGILRTSSDGERFIEAAYVARTGQGTVAPIGMGVAAIGGASLLYNPETGAGQQGVKAWRKIRLPNGEWQWESFNLPGVNNVGLLVKTWGRVSWVGTGEFYVDDGCGLRDMTDHPGIRVLAPGVPPPPEGAFVELVGIVSCYKLDGSVCRMILVASESDLKIW
ncbi:MAG: hypothetical protein N3B12_07415, partial [Armatimonadetes bacterium]|nr:hypothetical protein [Armatimonadota bacterium]